jgi:hypothetical protein
MQSLINRIEKLDPKYHIIIGAILRKDDKIKFNENQTGVMINTSTVNENSVKEVLEFLSYLEEQESILHKIESKQEELSKNYFEDNSY